MYQKLMPHRGHKIACVSYGDWDNPADVCLECEDCNEVLISAESAEDPFLTLFNHLYTLLYEGKIPENRNMVGKCEEWIATHKTEIKALIERRGDCFTSDRELNALALALNL